MNARFGDLACRGALGLKRGKPVRGTKEARDHMAKVAQLPCVCCRRPGPSEVHHCISGRYGQAKASDFETIPLCAQCHRLGPMAIHRSKQEWQAEYGMDYHYLPVVSALLSGDDDALARWF